MMRYIVKIIIFIYIFLNPYLYAEDWIKVRDFMRNGEIPLNILCLDSTNCMVLTRYSGNNKVLSSKDGGLNWKTVDSTMEIPTCMSYPVHNRFFVYYRDNEKIVKNDINGNKIKDYILKINYRPQTQQVKDQEISMSDTVNGIFNIGNRLIITMDGWASTDSIFPDNEKRSIINCNWFFDKLNFSCFDYSNRYLFTTNGGKSFEKIQFEHRCTDIFFLNDSIGYLIGFRKLSDDTNKEIIYKSTNKGRNWTEIYNVSFDDEEVYYQHGANRIYMYDELIGTYISGHGGIVQTDDGWKTWKRVILLENGIKPSTPWLDLTYSGKRPLIALQNWGVFTQIDTILINMPIPELIEPQDKSITMTTDINFKWKNTEGINMYVFHLSSNKDFSDTLRLDTLEHNPLQTEFQEYIVIDLVACSEYYWKVASYKEGRVKWSVPFSFNTGKIPVSLVYPENNSTEISQEVVVNWNKLNGSNRYHLQCSYDDNFNDLFFSQDTLSETEHSFNKLPENTEIFWRVRGYCKEGFAEWSETWKFRTKLNTSVSDNNFISKILLSPNPAGDYITISCGSIGACSNDYGASPIATVQIFNILGLKVSSSGEGFSLADGGGYSIDVSHLPAGVYYVRITGSNGACSIVEKFVKM